MLGQSASPCLATPPCARSRDSDQGTPPGPSPPEHLLPRKKQRSWHPSLIQEAAEAEPALVPPQTPPRAGRLAFYPHSPAESNKANRPKRSREESGHDQADQSADQATDEVQKIGSSQQASNPGIDLAVASCTDTQMTKDVASSQSK
eukprot:s376_g17.t1